MIIQEKNQTSFAEVILEQTPGLFFCGTGLILQRHVKKKKKNPGTVEP